jgi:hypothetical protein
VQNEVDIYPSSDVAGVFVALAQNPQFQPCMQAAFQATAGSQGTVTVNQLSALSIPNASDLGVDSAAALSATLTISQGGQTGNASIQLVALQKGDALAVVTVTVPPSTSGPTPTSTVDIQPLAKAAAAKLGTAG